MIFDITNIGSIDKILIFHPPLLKNIIISELFMCQLRLSLSPSTYRKQKVCYTQIRYHYQPYKHFKQCYIYSHLKVRILFNNTRGLVLFDLVAYYTIGVTVNIRNTQYFNHQESTIVVNEYGSQSSLQLFNVNTTDQLVIYSDSNKTYSYKELKNGYALHVSSLYLVGKHNYIPQIDQFDFYTTNKIRTFKLNLKLWQRAYCI